MKKTVVNRFLTLAIIMALFLAYSASSNGLILCISEFGHVQIENKISINYYNNGPAPIDDKLSNVYDPPISCCGSCEDIEFSQAGLISSSAQRYKEYYQPASSTSDFRGSREYVFNDDFSYRFNENHDFTPGHTQNIISITILIC